MYGLQDIETKEYFIEETGKGFVFSHFIRDAEQFEDQVDAAFFATLIEKKDKIKCLQVVNVYALGAPNKIVQ